MIKAILQSFYSKQNKAGNCYWAFRWTDVATGRRVEGTICGGESNISWIVKNMGLEWHEVHYSITQLNIRTFDSMVKGWTHAGCQPENLAAFIKETLTTMPIPSPV